MTELDKVFSGSIPALYEQHLVPLIFEPYAEDVVRRVAAAAPGSVLEIAAGTGAVTRQMAAQLPATATIIATDLNQAMLDQAAALPMRRPVQWRQADAMHLPFDDASVDAIVCQFGMMFFPDRVKAIAEMHRVLRPGGTLLFSVWDRIEDNEFAHHVSDAVAALFPGDPPAFLPRTPYGYHDRDRIAGDVAAGGFSESADIDTVTARSRAQSAEGPAIGFVQGTPLRGEIEARDPSALGRATDAAIEAIARRFGPGPVDGRIQAHVVTVRK